MKKVFSLLIVIGSLSTVRSQNVGIGTTNPTYPLTVFSSGSEILSLESNSNSSIKFSIAATGQAHIKSLKKTLCLTANPAQTYIGDITIKPDGNVGIGVDPQFKLDVGGRIRIRNSSNTAGIWLDGVETASRAFVGIINEDHVGMYGNAGADWNFAMNVVNGNTGIGTSAPTARLDVNGNMRIRTVAAKRGSVLTSTDVNGNTQWANPVAFRVAGLSGGANAYLPKETWSKIEFNTTASLNLGFYYQPLQSQFSAGEKGIYSFTTQLTSDPVRQMLVSQLRLRVNRGGIISTLVQHDENAGNHLGSAFVYSPPFTNFSSGPVQLEAGDIVWVEFNAVNVVDVITSQAYSEYIILNNPLLTWFSGSLVARN